MRHRIIIQENDGKHEYECANAFVSRTVSAVHHENHADAREVCKILNAHFEKEAANVE